MPPDGKKYYADEFKYLMRQEQFDFFNFVNDTSKKLGKTLRMRCNGKGLEMYVELYKPDNYLGKNTGNWRVDSIRKIIQSGPVTTLITGSGQKIRVRNQDEDMSFDAVIGFLMVLIKYMFDKKIYTDLIGYIFAGRPIDDKLNRMAIIGECKAVLISKIGTKNLDQLLDKFRENFIRNEV